MPVHAATAGSAARAGATRARAREPEVDPELTSNVQFHPYSAGCETRADRLAPKVTVATVTAAARTLPAMTDRSGTAERPAAGSRASRIPSAAGTGRPQARAACPKRAARPPPAAERWPRGG